MSQRFAALALLVTCTLSARSQVPPTPSLLATAGAAIAESDSPWTGIVNPAAIPNNGLPCLLLWSWSPSVVLPDLTLGGASLYLGQRFRDGLITLAGTAYRSYHDLRISVSIPFPVSTDIQCGASLGLRIRAVEEVGTTFSPAVSFAISLQATSDLRITGCWSASQDDGRASDHSLAVGTAFAVSADARIVTRFVETTSGAREASLGLVISPAARLQLRAGISTNASRIAAGASLTAGPCIVDVALTTNEETGLGSVVGVVVPL